MKNIILFSLLLCCFELFSQSAYQPAQRLTDRLTWTEKDSSRHYSDFHNLVENDSCYVLIKSVIFEGDTCTKVRIVKKSDLLFWGFSKLR